MAFEFRRIVPIMVALSMVTVCLITFYTVVFSDMSRSGPLYNLKGARTGHNRSSNAHPSLARLVGDNSQGKGSRSTISKVGTIPSIVNGSASLTNESISHQNNSDLIATSEQVQGQGHGHEQDQVQGQESIVRSHPVSLEICPNRIKMSPDKAKVVPRKEEISLEKVRAEILGDQRERALELAAVVNETFADIVGMRRKMAALKMKTMKSMTIDETMEKMGLSVDIDDYRVLPGGHWVPTSCIPRWKVAIVVPFRDRFKNLPIFLRHIIPFLRKQQLEFSVFITEQRNSLSFNRATLMNVGFLEALNFTNYDCVVFHDVDHIALSVENYFGCEGMPRHFISGEAMWNYKIIYEALFGGVSGLTTDQFHQINGLPNVYWGWGGEDDDFYARVQNKGYKKSRPKGAIGYFDTMEHKSTTGKSKVANPARFCLLKRYRERMAGDGLSNLRYERPIVELLPLYTNISVNIQKLPWNPAWGRCPGGV